MAKRKESQRGRTGVSQLVAEAVAVLCPKCGEPQPNPVDGSEQWSVSDFARIASPRRVCVSCDAEMFVWITSKVMFQ